jgi:methylmalonyl-CoA mutase
MTEAERWKAVAGRELKGRDPETLTWATPEGIAVRPVYLAADAEGLAHLGAPPGAPPNTRGPKATM